MASGWSRKFRRNTSIFPTPKFVITHTSDSPTSNNMTRKAQASETVAICGKGFYTAPSGRRVDMAAEIDRAKSGTKLYSPDDFHAGKAKRSSPWSMKRHSAP
jgi:hypothetical protein